MFFGVADIIGEADIVTSEEGEKLGVWGEYGVPDGKLR